MSEIYLNLADYEATIKKAAEEFLAELAEYSKGEIDPNSGIQVYLNELESPKRNFTCFSVGSPSKEAERDCVRQAAFSEARNVFSSENCVNPGRFIFPGSVTIENQKGIKIQASVAGLKVIPANVYMAVRLGAFVNDEMTSYTATLVIRKRQGVLPIEFVGTHYLAKLITVNS